ncbi:MAG: fructose 1,6-bisphosphatase [Anaerolineae bacterium SG8_19]|jgi:fructose-1,6-bisphosphatase I|nr:MAG: fructose 1,6-bisphosphatase [Anaerolineae bacterium SG8_19]
MDNIVTIERFILNNQPETAVGDFTNLLYDIALAAKAISAKMLRAGLIEILGQAGSTNVQGEEQQKLDLYADEIMVKLCDHTGRLCVMASEEHKDIIQIPELYPKGRYVLVFDPLDGSSNIDVNVSTGTIFGIYRCVDWEKRGRLEDCLQPAGQLVSAGYVLFGASTLLVYTTGNGVHGFTLDPDLGEFLLSRERIQVPEPGRYFSGNYGYRENWTEGVRRYAEWLEQGGGIAPPLSGRYIGSLVGDFHRNLLLGGVFLYPGQMNKPDGKLRLLYEAGPLSFIIDQAGGYASDGRRPILDIVPETLHQRTPLFIGNRILVEKAEEMIAENDIG